MLPFKAVLSKRAYSEVFGSVNASESRHEVGGLLLGYKIFKTYFIVATTADNSGGTNISFMLDGEKHSAYVKDVIKRFFIKPRVIGAWHSHVCDILCFSEQDKESNASLAAAFGGALSLLVTKDEQRNKLNMLTAFVTPCGKEQPCRTVIFL